MSNQLTLNGGQPSAVQAHPADQLTQEDQALVWTTATLLLDVVPLFSTEVTKVIYAQLSGLPRDEDLYTALEAVAIAGPRELLTTLRAGMPASAHETPVEMLAHARYLRGRGVGLQSLIDIYQVGVPMFRNIVRREIEERATDRAQFERIAAAADEYTFAFISTVLARQASEFGALHGGWSPTADDPAFANQAAVDGARRLREEHIASGTWLRESPEHAGARGRAERALDVFAATIERGVADHEIGHLLRLADTTLTITLADELDLSITLLLDREPVEVVDGESDTESRMWIASVDLERIWWPDFYLAMAITSGRVRMQGRIRKFLRVVPLMRRLADVHDEVAASMEAEEDSHA